MEAMKNYSPLSMGLGNEKKRSTCNESLNTDRLCDIPAAVLVFDSGANERRALLGRDIRDRLHMHHGLREDTRNSYERTRGLVAQV